MNEQQQQLEHEEPGIRTGIQAGDQWLGNGGAIPSGSGDDPSRGGGTIGSGT
jgi:hypothetical protein